MALSFSEKLKLQTKVADFKQQLSVKGLTFPAKLSLQSQIANIMAELNGTSRPSPMVDAARLGLDPETTAANQSIDLFYPEGVENIIPGDNVAFARNGGTEENGTDKVFGVVTDLFNDAVTGEILGAYIAVRNSDQIFKAYFSAGTFQKIGLVKDEPTVATVEEPKPSAIIPISIDETTDNTPAAGQAALMFMKPFMPTGEWKVVRDSMKGEEGQYFIDMMVNLMALIKKMPKSYATDGQGERAIAYLHYFGGATDIWVTESPDDPTEDNAFGFTILNGDKQNAEMGAQYLPEIVSAGLELDLHWKPISIEKVKQEEGFAGYDTISPPPTAEELAKVSEQTDAQNMLSDIQSGKYNTLPPPQFMAIVKKVVDVLGLDDRVKLAVANYAKANAPKVK